MNIEIKLLDKNKNILKNDSISLKEIKKYETLANYVRANRNRFPKGIKFLKIGVGIYEIDSFLKK